MKNMELAWATLTSPTAAFAELRERPRALLPLLLILLGTVIVVAWYYASVDFPWLVEHLLDADPRTRNMPPAARAKAMGVMRLPILMGSSVIGAALVVMLMRGAEAAYFSLAGKITNVQYSFRHWFALTCWTALPHFFGILVMAGFLLLSPTNQIGTEELQLLSLNELFFHRTMGQPGYALLSNLTLLSPWVWTLTVIGVRTWSGRSWLFSTFFALLPQILIYGIWAAFALRSA